MPSLPNRDPRSRGERDTTDSRDADDRLTRNRNDCLRRLLASDKRCECRGSGYGSECRSLDGASFFAYSSDPIARSSATHAPTRT